MSALSIGAIHKSYQAPPGAKEALIFQLRGGSGDKRLAEAVAFRIAGNPWVIVRRVDTSGAVWWEVPLSPDQEITDFARAAADPDIMDSRTAPWPPDSGALFDLGKYARMAYQLAKAREIRSSFVSKVLDGIGFLFSALAGGPPVVSAC